MTTGPYRRRAPNVPTFADVLDGYRLEDTWVSRQAGRHHRADPVLGFPEPPAGHAPWPVASPHLSPGPLEIETLISTSPRGRDQGLTLWIEQQMVVDLCRQPRSVAEVAAVLRLPLGITKGLLDGMAGRGLVTVHRPIAAHGGAPDLAWMERVLNGLRQI